MTSAPDDAIAAADLLGRHFGVQWQGGLTSVASWAVQRGTPSQDAAWKFLAFASDPAHQAELAQRVAYGPVVSGADKSMPAASWSATPSAHLADLLPIDEGFWQTHLDALTQRFADWVKG
jgi:putative spermidine/putrescine transport system substrate-binding protein